MYVRTGWPEKNAANFQIKSFEFFFGQYFWKIACKYLWHLNLYIWSQKNRRGVQSTISALAHTTRACMHYRRKKGEFSCFFIYYCIARSGGAATRVAKIPKSHGCHPRRVFWLYIYASLSHRECHPTSNFPICASNRLSFWMFGILTCMNSYTKFQPNWFMQDGCTWQICPYSEVCMTVSHCSSYTVNWYLQKAWNSSPIHTLIAICPLKHFTTPMAFWPTYAIFRPFVKEWWAPVLN